MSSSTAPSSTARGAVRLSMFAGLVLGACLACAPAPASAADVHTATAAPVAVAAPVAAAAPAILLSAAGAVASGEDELGGADGRDGGQSSHPLATTSVTEPAQVGRTLKWSANGEAGGVGQAAEAAGARIFGVLGAGAIVVGLSATAAVRLRARRSE